MRLDSEVEMFIARLKGDVADNLASFQRKMGPNKSTSVLQNEIAHSKRHAKENKRHSVKRKEKICRSELNFVISSEMIKEENLSKLKYRQHFRGIEFLLNKMCLMTREET